MPTYTYRCDACEHVFDIFHSMSDECDECLKCGKQGTVKKIPAKPIQPRKNTNLKKSKAGTVVREYIKDVKREIQAEKQNLKNKEYTT